MGSIMESQDIMGSDYGSNISEDRIIIIISAVFTEHSIQILYVSYTKSLSQRSNLVLK